MESEGNEVDLLGSDVRKEKVQTSVKMVIVTIFSSCIQDRPEQYDHKIRSPNEIVMDLLVKMATTSNRPPSV